jgi:rhodanese-related sulfurtransferase
MSEDYAIILPDEVKERLSKGEELNIIDVREDEEVAAGMIPGAKHIRLGDLPFSHEKIQKTDEIIMVCRSGGRSGKACEYLQLLGFKGLKNMAGGMLEWETL